ncbi:bifunctional glutamate N-acetyltransferase/amino-acid acetyltransferase ArgJ [Solemya elarraichensis gill symbiont]|uniref:Arginine biosynthesis bifunctional protein ArgJ n=1 Tax=Solemya elarraichensis gill symbiont TaxID=1918949 RepID=A0A1T2LBX5_9GAMM|nr:bifunctional glutamate N-acetyltransferase/amino-acid acetyltransferase ArgJ [Solemya elarraichensis gill symbiont]OOZ42603.1 bifunctional ornithine acetyltransferase/N-acetylglutamate synthase [Solemya elarraichensis gill symbiont]
MTVSDKVYPVAGIRLASVAAGIRYSGRDDLVAIELADNATVAAVFTRNAFCAAPVTVAREHIEAGTPRYLLVNSGNANAGTGDNGLRAARESCKSLAAAAGCALNQVAPFSTGVIGEDLNTQAIAAAVPSLLEGLQEAGWERASQAIMTTDTVAKLVSRRVTVGDSEVTVTGMAKGSGMIRPDMATMLAYVATDAAISRTLLQQCLNEAVAPSFNSITVDGDTSTNDACVLIASGCSDVVVDDLDSSAGVAVRSAILDVCMELARSIVRDGEGATKLVEIHVSGAASDEEAKSVAYTVAHSPLVKTAMFASDPNWGRILAAVGRAGVENLDLDAVRILLDDVLIVSGGGRDSGYTEEAGQAVMDKDAYTIHIELGRGEASSLVLTCDLSFDYVKINAEYRS